MIRARPAVAEPQEIAVQRGLRRIHRNVIGVRSLEVPSAEKLLPRDRLRTARDVRPDHPPVQIVFPAPPAKAAVHSARHRLARQQPGQIGAAVEGTTDAGEDRAYGRVAGAVLLLHPGGAVGREWLHGHTLVTAARRVEGAHRLAVGKRSENAHGEPGRQAPRDLGRAQDRGVVHVIHVVGLRTPLRRRTDAPGIEYIAQVEQPGPLGEEGPALVVEGLERGEIDLRGVRVHLPEVRIQRGVESQARPAPSSDRHRSARRDPPGCRRGSPCPRRLPRSPRSQRSGVSSTRRAGRIPDSPVSIPIREAQPVWSRPTSCQSDSCWSAGRTRFAFNPQICSSTPWKQELGEGDAHLGGPSLPVHRDFRFPDRVEGIVPAVLEILRVQVVDPSAGRRHHEGVRRPPVEEGVEGIGPVVPHLPPRPAASRRPGSPPGRRTCAPRCRGRIRCRRSGARYPRPRGRLRSAPARRNRAEPERASQTAIIQAAIQNGAFRHPFGLRRPRTGARGSGASVREPAAGTAGAAGPRREIGYSWP